MQRGSDTGADIILILAMLLVMLRCLQGGSATGADVDHKDSDLDHDVVGGVNALCCRPLVWRRSDNYIPKQNSSLFG